MGSKKKKTISWDMYKLEIGKINLQVILNHALDRVLYGYISNILTIIFFFSSLFDQFKKKKNGLKNATATSKN